MTVTKLRPRSTGNGRFLIMPHSLLQSERWRATSPGARALFLEIWQRFNGSNNGDIPYSQREAVETFRCSTKRAVKWFSELQSKEHGDPLIRCICNASFDNKKGAQAGKARRWEIDPDIAARAAKE